MFSFWGEFLHFLNVKNVISTHTNDFYEKKGALFRQISISNCHIYTIGYASNHNIK